MKTMKRNSEVIRVPEEKVENFLNGGYVYCPKSEWKQNVRDADRKETAEPKKSKKTA